MSACNDRERTSRYKRTLGSHQNMIRPTKPEDTPLLVSLTEQTRMFRDHEIPILEELLDGFHAAPGIDRSVTKEDNGQVKGFAYYALSDITDRSWYLYWIVVGRDSQGKGFGGELLEYMERDIANADGRLIFVETSSVPRYDKTRSFYLKHGYDTVAVLPDYYADDDSMVVFRKRLK